MNDTVLQPATKPIDELESVVVRFAGDSGDGMQLAGSQLTSTSALAGNDVATFPDFPAEIRAPKGTLAGVSGFQVHFASRDIYTPGDMVDVLVAMNPAALVENLRFLQPQGTLIVDEDAFDAKGLKLARVPSSPLDDGSLDGFNVIRVPLTKLTREAVEGPGVGRKLATRCRNFFAMGLVYWLYGRDLEPTLRWVRKRFRNEPEVLDANEKALRTGWSFGETTEALARSYHVPPAALEPGEYRNITGNQALAAGLIAAAELSGKPLFYGSYPITPGERHPPRARPPQALRGAHLPGRGRDRRGDLRHRRRLRGRDGGDRVQRPRHRAQDRGDGARGHAGAAAAGAEHPARGSEHRTADQARAVGTCSR